MHIHVSYNPADHVITGDLKINNNASLRGVFASGPKYREPKYITGNITLKFLWIPFRIMPDNEQTMKWRT